MARIKSVLAIGGGLLTAGGAVWFARRKADATTDAIKQAVSGKGAPAPSLPPSAHGTAAASGVGVNLRLTGYWPFTARADERKLEGGVNDRKGRPLHTVEDFFAGRADHVSLSGDDSIFPYGQRIDIPWGDRTIIGRVTDTGGHFRGAGKLIRVTGYEPIDVCVESSATKIPKILVNATLVPGDALDKAGRTVATSKLAQNRIAGLVDGRTAEDREALARALESELGGRPREELLAAGWAIRNRADRQGVSVHDLLAPSGYGAPSKSGGYASTRRVPTEIAFAVADDVLDAATSEDPTGGAIEFWVPSQQDKMHQFGDVYRAAVKAGDSAKSKRFQKYAGYLSEGEVRVQHAREGLGVLATVGIVELLGKVS